MLLQATCSDPAAEKYGKLPPIIRLLFRSAVEKKSSNTALELRIHTVVWQRSGATSLMAVKKKGIQNTFVGIQQKDVSRPKALAL